MSRIDRVEHPFMVPFSPLSIVKGQQRYADKRADHIRKAVNGQAARIHPHKGTCSKSRKLRIKHIEYHRSSAQQNNPNSLIAIRKIGQKNKKDT